MIVSLLCPKMRRELNELAAIPLEKFSSIKAVSHYLEALIKSGVAAEEDRGVIYVMGNTSVGKTSLVNTFKNYIENPTDQPTSFLTHKDDQLIETKVLEIYKSVDLGHNNTALDVALEELTPNVGLLSFKEAAPVETTKKRL